MLKKKNIWLHKSWLSLSSDIISITTNNFVSNIKRKDKHA